MSFLLYLLNFHLVLITNLLLQIVQPLMIHQQDYCLRLYFRQSYQEHCYFYSIWMVITTKLSLYYCFTRMLRHLPILIPKQLIMILILRFLSWDSLLVMINCEYFDYFNSLHLPQILL